MAMRASYSSCGAAMDKSLTAMPRLPVRKVSLREDKSKLAEGSRVRESASDLWSLLSVAERPGWGPRRPSGDDAGGGGSGSGGSALRASVADAHYQVDPPLCRQDAEHITIATKHESIISDIGAEYLRTASAVGKFRQLRKPLTLQNGEAAAKGGSRNSTLKSVKEDEKQAQVSVVLPRNPSEDGAAPDSDAKLASSVGGHRLGRKKLLGERRRVAADFCLALALFGIVLMMVETECTLNSLYDKADIYSHIMKSLISVSSGLLLAATALYHIIDLQLYLLNNCLEDWRIVMTAGRLSQILVEMVICAIHPPPGTRYMAIAVLDRDLKQWQQTSVPVDVVFSLPMFARLYLVIRGLLLHSKLFNDTSSRTIGALNKIKFDARFIIKMLMTICPGKVLFAFLVTVWTLGAWMLRFCEYYHNDKFGNYFNAVYMIIITFLSVGYGDIVPLTYCGRGIAMASGLVGAGCTALLVALIANKLELTRAEKLVHSFMMDSQLTKQLKDSAANVLRETWMIYKHTKLVDRLNSSAVRLHQRKFLSAIQRLRRVKGQQRKNHEETVAIVNAGKTQSGVYESIIDLKQQQTKIQSTLTNVEDALQALELQIRSIQPGLQQWLGERHTASIYVSMPDVSQQDCQQGQINVALPTPP